MNRHDVLLEQLAARTRAAAEPPAEMPPLLPARVFAALHRPRTPDAPWEILALRALPAALGVFLLCLWLAPGAPQTLPASVEDILANAIFDEVLAP